MLEYIKETQGVQIGSIKINFNNPSDVDIRSSHAQSFLICNGREIFYDDNGVRLYTKQTGGTLSEIRKKIEEDIKRVEKDIIARKDVPLDDMIYFQETFCDFKWKLYMTEQITKIIRILQEHNDDTHKLTPVEIEKLFFIFSDLFYTYDMSRDVSIQASTIELPETKNDMFIRYITDFEFYMIENFDETNIDIAKENIFSKITVEDYNRYNIYDIDEGKIFDLIDSEDIIQLKYILLFDIREKKENYLHYASEKRKLKALSAIRENDLSRM